MNDEARFWDKRAEKYAQRPVADQAAYEKKLEITRRYFNPDSVVLEIGCGTGSTALAHAPYVGHILATDISPNMIGIARPLCIDPDFPVRLLSGELAQAPDVERALSGPVQHLGSG